MVTSAVIVSYDGTEMTVVPSEPLTREILQKRIRECEIHFFDGRRITPEQRRKAYALIRDISDWSGHMPEEIKEITKWNFCAEDGRESFSLADIDKTTAREYISYLIEFCFANNVPTRDTCLDRTEDIGKYLYTCLEYRKCTVCNAKADIHHVDAVGLGRNRETIIHTGMNAVALCRKHHQEAHNIGKDTFFERYHIYAIPLDDYLCGRLKLNTRSNKLLEI